MKHPKVLKTAFLTILLSLPLLVGCNKKKGEKTTKKGGTNTVTTLMQQNGMAPTILSMEIITRRTI